MTDGCGDFLVRIPEIGRCAWWNIFLWYRAILLLGKIHSLLFVGTNIWIQIFVIMACLRNLKKCVYCVSALPAMSVKQKGHSFVGWPAHLYNWSLVSILSLQHCQWSSSLWELFYNLFYFLLLFCICFNESEHCCILWFDISPPNLEYIQ